MLKDVQAIWRLSEDTVRIFPILDTKQTNQYQAFGSLTLFNSPVLDPKLWYEPDQRYLYGNKVSKRLAYSREHGATSSSL
jgi:hypothetical protein